MSQQCILVDEYDNPLGYAEKWDTHRRGLLHRAFSVYLFDNRGNILLQQRAMSKYHTPGLWANACCSHQFPGENSVDAAVRRLKEELGCTSPLQYVTEFVYNTPVPPDLIEHEYLHVFVGIYDGSLIVPNSDEVMNISREPLDRFVDRVMVDDPSLVPWTRITRKHCGSRIMSLLSLC